MEPAPPRAPLSIRIWGWIILVSSVLNLIAFSTSMMGSIDLSRWPHETLLLSAGVRISADGAGADPVAAASMG
jgi:hypothetical protein